MNKRMLLASVAATVALTTLTYAEGELSSNVAVTSNYVWRGVSQTADQAAVSGGLDYAHDSGLYVGTWVSNVDFGAGGQTEWDLYVGYAGESGDLGYDVSIAAYTYPDVEDANFYDLNLGFSYNSFSVGMSYTLASDVVDTADAECYVAGDMYFYVGYGMDLAEDLSLALTGGYYMFDEDGVADTDLDYFHLLVDLTKSVESVGDFTFSLSVAEEEAGDADVIPYVTYSKSF